MYRARCGLLASRGLRQSVTCAAARGRARKDASSSIPAEPDKPAAAARKSRASRKTSQAAAAAPAKPEPDAEAPLAAAPKRGRRSKTAAVSGAPAAAAAAGPAPLSPAPSTSSLSSAATDPSAAEEDIFFFEGGQVTASQELEAMEDDVPSRLHMGFSDPLHSMEDVSFHHDQELLPGDLIGRSTPGRAPAGGSGVRVRAPQRGPAAPTSNWFDDAEGAGAAAAAAAAAPAPAVELRSEGKGAEAAPAAGGEIDEEDGWTKWRKFKEGTLPEDEMAYYRSLQEADVKAEVPAWLTPTNSRELDNMRRNLEMQEKLLRVWEEEDYLYEAFAIHHYQNETGINRYMNTRQMAGYMAAVELEDHQSPDPNIMRFPSWARAEHRWAHDYDAFNQHLEKNMEQYIIKLPPGAEDAEDIDILDDVLLLSDDKQNAALTSSSTAGGGEEGGEGGAAAAAAEGLDQWLVGVLPGGGGAAAGSQQLMEEMLGDEAVEEDLDA